MFKYKNPGRIKAEEEILWELKRKHCNSSLLGNPRTIEDLADQLGQYCIHWYSPKMPDVSDIEYEKCILPRIEMLVYTEGMIEKVSIFDKRRYGIDKLFKSIRYVYDKNGIETEREIEKLKREEEYSRTIYFFKERLPNNPHIIKITANSKPTKVNGRVSYYDIRQSRQIEDLSQKKGKKIEEKDIRGLTEEEQQEVLERQINPIYQQGIKSLMGIGIEPGGR